MYNRLIHENSIMYKRNFNNSRFLDRLKIYVFIFEYINKYDFPKEYKEKFKKEFYSTCCSIEKNNILTQKDLNEYKKLKARLEYKFGFKSLLENIFLVKTSDTHKIITILGIKLKFKLSKLQKK